MKIYQKYDNYIFDLDGTVYLGNEIIPGANDTINFLIEQKKNVVFISNKTIYNVGDYAKILNKFGIKIAAEQIINATLVIADFLKSNFPKAKFYAIGEKKFIESLEKIGLVYTENVDKIEIVIITLDRFLNDKKIQIAKEAILKGANFFAANIDNTCPVEGKKQIIDAGIVIKELESLTKKKLELHFGKPTEFMINYISKFIEINDKTILIGDRLETDILMGKKMKIDTAWVQTGISYLEKDIKVFQPTYVLTSIWDILSYEI